MMNFVFLFLGFSTMFNAQSFRKKPFLAILLGIFGLSLALTGTFSHAPLNPAISYSAISDRLHSLFASSTGMAFTLFTVVYAIATRDTHQKRIALGVGITAAALSMLIFSVSDYAGVWQRTMFIISFAWLLYILRSPE